MNDEMYAHPATRANLARARARGAGRSWVPRSAPLAEGPSERPGRMSEPETILAHAARLLRRGGPARRAAGGGDRGPDARVDRSGAGRDQPLERQDGIPPGRGGVGARRRRGADQRARSRSPPPIGVHRPIGRDDGGAGAGGARGAAGGRRADHGGGARRLPAQRARATRKRAAHRRRAGHSDGADGRHPAARRAARRKPGSVIVGFALETGDAHGQGRGPSWSGRISTSSWSTTRSSPAPGFEVDTNRVALLDREGNARILPLAVEARGGRGDPRRRGGSALADELAAVSARSRSELGGARGRPRASRAAREAGGAAEVAPRRAGRPAAAAAGPAPLPPTWQKGAPPIPGPGPRGRRRRRPTCWAMRSAPCDTLEAVAERIRHAPTAARSVRSADQHGARRGKSAGAS